MAPTRVTHCHPPVSDTVTHLGWLGGSAVISLGTAGITHPGLGIVTHPGLPLGWCHLPGDGQGRQASPILGQTLSPPRMDLSPPRMTGEGLCNRPVVVSPCWCWPVPPSGTSWVWGRLVSLLWGPLASPMGTLRDTWTLCHPQSPGCSVCQGHRGGRWVFHQRGDPAGSCQVGRAGRCPSWGPQHCQGNTGHRTQWAGGHSGGRRRLPPPACW